MPDLEYSLVKQLEPLEQSSAQQIEQNIIKFIKKLFNSKSHSSIKLLSPLVTNRKGHHKPIVNWALEKGSKLLGVTVNFDTEGFEGLDRYRLHDIEVEVGNWEKTPFIANLKSSIDLALKGQGRCLTVYGIKEKKNGFPKR